MCGRLHRRRGLQWRMLRFGLRLRPTPWRLAAEPLPPARSLVVAVARMPVARMPVARMPVAVVTVATDVVLVAVVDAMVVRKRHRCRPRRPLPCLGKLSPRRPQPPCLRRLSSTLRPFTRPHASSRPAPFAEPCSPERQPIVANHNACLSSTDRHAFFCTHRVFEPCGSVPLGLHITANILPPAK